MTGSLPEPRTPAGRAGLAALLADPAHALVACDFDGTLAPIVEDPAAARAHPQAVPALALLGRSIGHLLVITGRPAAVAVEYGGFAAVPGLERLVVLGHYGRERWDATSSEVAAPEPDPGVAAVRRDLPALLAEVAAPDGTWVEDKGGAVAVHTRRTADPDRALAALRGPLTDLAERHGLTVEPGRMVIELRPAGMDKGQALLAYARDVHPSAVLFAGDDLGDLAAFDAVETLRGAGVPGVTVCSGSAEVTQLAARADLVVPGPDGVVALLEALGAG